MNYNVDKYSIFILFNKSFNIITNYLNFIKFELLLTIFGVQINIFISKCQGFEVNLGTESNQKQWKCN